MQTTPIIPTPPTTPTYQTNQYKHKPYTLSDLQKENIESNATLEAKTYPVLLNTLLKYIISIKEQDKETSIMDLILEFGMRNSLDIELIGDAISTDEYLKNIISKDLEMNNYNSVKIQNNDW
jgi:hypothetical protein